MVKKLLLSLLLITAMAVASGNVWAAEAPAWAVAQCQGLKSFADVAYYWIDRQNPDGSFGFGLDDDCEFYKTWPIFVLAADDQRVLESLRKAMDWVWYNDGVQDGFAAEPRDAQHNSEITAYTQPVMTVIDYGNPIFIERLMATSKNMERWTGINHAGHRHFRSNWIGSQGVLEYAYFASDAGIVSRATIPMMHLLWYNRDPFLARYYTEWGRAWVDHARETTWGKPYGILPVEVVFETDEAGGFTKNWKTSAAAPSKYDRMHQMLMINYMVTGDADFLLPVRTQLAQQVKAGGVDVELWGMYRWLTGDTRYDGYTNGRPLRPTRQMVLDAGRKAAELGRESMEIAKTINIKNSVDNYRAKFDNEPFSYYLYELYTGTNCWPSKDYVDFPLPAVRWLKGNYELGVILLEHEKKQLRAVCCNIGRKSKTFGAQVFELEPGAYLMTLGVDTNGDDQADRPIREEIIKIERGTEIALPLEPAIEYVVELKQLTKGPQWTSRADLAVCDRDIYSVPAAPVAGTETTLKIRLHNIGTEDAAQVSVWAEELPAGKLIGQRTVARVPAPRNMEPSQVMVTMPWTVGAEAKGVRVVVDADDVIEEIHEGNNQAEIVLADLPEGPREKRRVYLPDWYGQEQQGPIAQYTAPYISGGIVIDGKVDEPQWQKAERRGPLKNAYDVPNEKETYVRIAYGPDALYFAMECPEPNMDLLVEIATERDTYAIFEGDSFEFFIDTNLDKRTYYQFAASTNGLMAEGQYYNFDLYNEPWECKVHKGKDFWSAEAKIPYASLKTTPRPGQVWGMNIYRSVRSFRAPESESERAKGWKNVERNALSPTFSDFHQPRRFAEVTFGPKE